MEGRIFLTGGTGSLGIGLLRRAEARHWRCEFTVYSRDEVKQGDVRARFPKHRFILGDVRDRTALAVHLPGHDIVIHAAAYKQVPTAEVNAAEAVKTNVMGSQNLAEESLLAGIKRVIGISTDKACAPVNCYGETKAIMEKLMQQACLWREGATQFNLCRYGNVLGSRGSVVPFFRKQAERGGPITFTDPTMTRFWLNLQDALDLIELTLDEEQPGTIIVPKASASSMAVLAEAVAPTTKTKDIGLRPGEKMHECLLHRGESMHAEDLGSHFRIWPAYTGKRGNLPLGYEYTSDQAPQLSARDIREMLAQDVEAAECE